MRLDPLMLWLPLGLLVLAPWRSAAAQAPKAAPATLAARLQAEVGAGAPVAVVPSPQGLLALSADGARRRVLAPGEVPQALVDERSRALWFTVRQAKAQELWVIDLDGPESTPVRVATGLSGQAFAIDYPKQVSKRPEALRVKAGSYDGSLSLVMSARRPSLQRQSGVYEEIFDDVKAEHATSDRKARLTKEGAALVARLTERGKDGSFWLPPPPGKARRVTAVPERRCEQADLCGEAKALPRTRFLRVLVSHSCGDACHVDFQLYDSKAREFVDPATRKRSRAPLEESSFPLDDITLAADGSAVVRGGAIQRFDGKPVTAGEGLGGGWLGGSWYLE